MNPGDKGKPCRSCTAWIFWATTVAGKKMPLECEPQLDGTVWLDADGVAHVGASKAPAAATLYRTHFATCPGSKRWSGSSRAEQR